MYVVTEPEPDSTTTVEPGDPAVVALSDDDRSLMLLTACLLALGVGARIVGSFGGA